MIQLILMIPPTLCLMFSLFTFSFLSLILFRHFNYYDKGTEVAASVFLEIWLLSILYIHGNLFGQLFFIFSRIN